MVTFAKLTTIKTGTNKCGNPIHLTHRSAGEQIAGSRTIPVNEAWGVLWMFDGCQYGQWFKTETEAADYFNSRNKA